MRSKLQNISSDCAYDAYLVYDYVSALFVHAYGYGYELHLL